MQQLIINSGIEKTVLVDNYEQGEALTRNSWPRNVRAVYTPDCFSVGSRNGGLSMTAMRQFRGASRITRDITSTIKYIFIIDDWK